MVHCCILRTKLDVKSFNKSNIPFYISAAFFLCSVSTKMYWKIRFAKLKYILKKSQVDRTGSDDYIKLNKKGNMWLGSAAGV